MTGIITPAIGRSIGKQLKRVNHSPEAVAQKIVELQNDLDIALETIKDLRLKLGIKEGEVAPEPTYISASGFARRHQVAVSTITRKLKDHKLNGYQNDTGYWFVRADETYTKGKRGKAK